MILSYTQLLKLLDDGVIVGADPKAVNAASIDVRLGETFLYETACPRGREVVDIDLAMRQPLTVKKMDVAIGNSMYLEPGEFTLAQTIESFNLPDDLSAKFVLKSSIARSGLNQLSAVWCDAGWNNSVLTLELSNVTRRHRLHLTAGMYIGQMVFYKHEMVPDHASYRTRGRYNGDKTTKGVKL